MRTYGVQAASATEAQIVEALHDASIWAGVSRIAFNVGAAADGVLASTEVTYGKGRGAGAGDRLSLVACTAGPGGGFMGRGSMWGTRDIGKAARAVSDCLARGMIGYGSLEFLSAGRAQLRRAALDAQHVIQHVGGWYRASGNQDPLRDRRLGASGGGGMRLESLAGVAAFRGAFPLPRAGHSAPECAVAALPVPFGGEERGRHARSLAQSRQPRRAALLSNQVQPGIPVQKVGHLHPVPDGPEVIRDGPAEVVEPRIVVVLRHRLL